MVTSGTATFNPTVDEIITEANTRVFGAPELGYDQISALRSLNLVNIKWQNQGPGLWLRVQYGPQTLTQGQQTLTLPNDTQDIFQAVIVTSANLDLPVERISYDEYMALPNKVTQARPTRILVDRQAAAPIITFWPLPPDGTYSFKCWRSRRIQDITRATQTADIPYRFIPALISCLAYEMALKEPAKVSSQKRQELQLAATLDYRAAFEEDRERGTSTYVTPRLRPR